MPVLQDTEIHVTRRTSTPGTRRWAWARFTLGLHRAVFVVPIHGPCCRGASQPSSYTRTLGFHYFTLSCLEQCCSFYNPIHITIRSFVKESFVFILRARIARYRYSIIRYVRVRTWAIAIACIGVYVSYYIVLYVCVRTLLYIYDTRTRTYVRTYLYVPTRIY